MLPMFGFESQVFDIAFSDVALTVGIYLGIPFLLAVLTRLIVVKTKGLDWLNRKLIPVISPFTLFALLFTIVVMFSLKGNLIVSIPLDVVQVAIPLVIFFAIMFILMFYLAKKSGADYAENVALSFTASGNNFELAIAVSIGVFGINSGQAFVGVIGPLVEVPALILMVRLAFWLREIWYVPSNSN
jgi:ACR3 family arsenite transporter